MNKIVTLLSMFAFSVSLFGQVAKERMNKNYIEGKLANFQERSIPTSDTFLSKESIFLEPDVNFPLFNMAARQKMDSLIIEEFNESKGAWVSLIKQEFTYSPDSNLIHIVNGEYISGRWEKIVKWDLIFDQNGYQKQAIKYNWNNTINQWVNVYKYDYAYNDKGKMLLFIYHSWDRDLKNWTNDYKLEYAYNPDGKETMNSYSFWATDKKQWICKRKAETTFNSEGNITSYISYKLDLSTNLLYIETKTEYTYNDNGLCIQQTSFSNFINQIYHSGDKKDFIYDAGNNLMNTVYYLWDEYSKIWTTNSKSEYTYNSEGHLSSRLDYNWDTANGIWIKSYKMEAQWDQYGNKILEESYQYFPAYFPEPEQWIGIEKNQDAYDERGNHLLHYDFDWISNSSKWVEVAKYNYIYDENNNLVEDLWHKDKDLSTNHYFSIFKSFFSNDPSLKKSEVLMPPISFFVYAVNQEKIVNKPLDYTHYALQEETWKPFEKGTYYYSTLETSNIQSSLKNEGISVYPNPASDFITCDITDGNKLFLLKLFDLNGKCISSREYVSNELIPVSHLNNGIYFYKIITSGKAYQGKLLIK